jgi:hypothetical protein
MALIINNLHLEISGVDFVLKEDKAYNLHLCVNTLELWSVSTSSESKKIHKLARLELMAFNMTDSKMRHDILSTLVMGEGEFYDSDDINDININFSIPHLKLAVDTSEIPKFLRKLDPLAKPNQR